MRGTAIRQILAVAITGAALAAVAPATSAAETSGTGDTAMVRRLPEDGPGDVACPIIVQPPDLRKLLPWPHLSCP